MAVLQGKAYWACVTTPNTTYEPVYSVNLVVDDETAEQFRNDGYTVKDMEEGPALVIKRRVNGPNGLVRQAPKLMDKAKNEISVAVGNGSEVKVQYKPWETDYRGKKFKGLDFQAMQVLNLIAYQAADGAEFTSESDDEDEL